jgi:hypothetical protein
MIIFDKLKGLFLLFAFYCPSFSSLSFLEFGVGFVYRFLTRQKEKEKSNEELFNVDISTLAII